MLRSQRPLDGIGLVRIICFFVAQALTLPVEKTFVTPISDNRVEGDESFKMYVFNMSGAVLTGNKRTGSFTLYIKDSDSNVAPEFEASSYAFTVDENSPVGNSVGAVKAIDRNADDIPSYYIASGSSEIYTLSLHDALPI